MKKQMDLREFLTSRQANFRISFVSTYIPRKCGIATYTKDLTQELNILNPQHLCRIVALSESDKEPVTYPWEVFFQIEKSRKQDYIRAAQHLNKTSDYIFLQHEYGIFGGPDGEYVLDLVAKIYKPLITTFHTVLENPSPNQKRILQEIAKKSMICIVMVEEAVNRLVDVYGIPQSKIAVIHHGVPDIPFSLAADHKENIGVDKRNFLIGTINLLSENKGIEYIIQALPAVKKVVPHIRYLMVGQTHPLIKLQQGEKYRESLHALAKRLGVEKNIIEVNRYISLEDLVKYLQAMNIYLTPYLDLGQITSGTLAYAIGAGKCCIATPYFYAKSVLNGTRGVLVEPKSATAIAKAIIRLYKHPQIRERLKKHAYSYGRTMIWSRVALDYLHLITYLQIINGSVSRAEHSLKAS